MYADLFKSNFRGSECVFICKVFLCLEVTKLII